MARTDLDAFTSGHIRANDIDLYCEVRGSGPPLVLIEGLGAGTWLWEEQIPAFSRRFTTVAYDNRGSGQSDKPPGPYSISMMTDDLLALFDELELDRTHVLGVSMGGFIAQSLALRAPERVDRLVLVSATEGGSDHVPMSDETFNKVLTLDRKSRAGIRERMSLAFTDAFLQSDKIDHLIDVRLEHPQPDHAYEAQAKAGAECDLSDRIQDIIAPTLVTAATEDILVPVENAYRLAEKIPNSQLEIYEGYGHQFFVEIPDRFNEDVIDFLTEAG